MAEDLSKNSYQAQSNMGHNPYSILYESSQNQNYLTSNQQFSNQNGAQPQMSQLFQERIAPNQFYSTAPPLQTMNTINPQNQYNQQLNNQNSILQPQLNQNGQNPFPQQLQTQPGSGDQQAPNQHILNLFYRNNETFKFTKAFSEVNSNNLELLSIRGKEILNRSTPPSLIIDPNSKEQLATYFNLFSKYRRYQQNPPEPYYGRISSFKRINLTSELLLFGFFMFKMVGTNENKLRYRYFFLWFFSSTLISSCVAFPINILFMQAFAASYKEKSLEEIEKDIELFKATKVIVR